MRRRGQALSHRGGERPAGGDADADANDNWIELTLCYIVDYRLRRAAKDRLFTRLRDEIDATGGRVGIGATTFQLVDRPRLDIRLVPDRGSAGVSSG